MEERKVPTSFAVSIYGKIEPYQLNPMMSKARVRTFYKYLNRNGGYFSDEMSQYIIDHAAGTPVIGHFDLEKIDFTSHMKASESKAYGFIPPDNPNFSWEPFIDEDGIMRTYACFDVLLWTGRYAEAKLIPGKSQSMELNRDTIQGEWKHFEEDKTEAFVYSKCDLIGLCVLGDEVEPCFEGAAFYTANTQFNLYLSAMKEEIVKNFTLQLSNNKGGKKMPMKFDLPHESNFENLFNLMNPRFNEESEFTVDFMVHSVGEKELYAYSCKDGKNYLVSFSTNEEGVISLGEPQELSAVFGLAPEAAEVFTQLVGEGTIQDVKDKISEYELKIDELNKIIEEKVEEAASNVAADYTAKVTVLEEEVNNLKSQLSNYEAEKIAAIEAQKDEMIDSYANLLDAEEIANYKQEKAKYTLEELEGKLAILFTRKYKKPEGAMLPRGNSEESNNPTLAALKQYKMKKGE